MSSTNVLDLNESIEEGNPVAGEHPDSSRKYGGTMIQQYKYAIVGGFVTVALLIGAITLSALSLQRSNEALALATANAEAAKTIEREFIYALEGQNTDEHVSDDHQQAELVPAASKETPSPTPPPTPKPTPKPTTPQPTIPQPTDAPSDPHPLNPKWFHTDHEQYQNVLANNDNTTHPYLLAGNFCMRQSLLACGYDSYCPNGKGGDPYKGGPPKRVFTEEENQNQWAPIAGSTQAEGFGWIQVGTIPESEKGTEDNDYGKCWNWDEWTLGARGEIEDALGEETRQWILCCENAE